MIQVRGNADCCREDPVLDIPITIGTYPILLSNVIGQNTITQQPTPLAPLASFNYEEPAAAPLLPYGDSGATAPPFSSIEGIGKNHLTWLGRKSFIQIMHTLHIPLDPPTYEEATTRKPTTTDINAKTFKPSYPVFRRTPSYSTEANKWAAKIFWIFSTTNTQSTHLHASNNIV